MLQPFLKTFLAICGLMVLGASTLGMGATVRSDHTEVELVTTAAAIQPGAPFWIALRMKMDAGWHTYWKNPGAAGLPTTIKWELPSGLSAGPLRWPVPSIFETGGLVTYGYSGETLLLTRMFPTQELPLGQEVVIKARVTWLECKDVCIPGEADLTLKLPVQETTDLEYRDQWRDASFETTRAHWPQPNSSWRVNAFHHPGQITLVLTSEHAPVPTIEKAYLFSADARIDANAPQPLKVGEEGVALHLTPNPFAAPRGESLAGVLSLKTASGPVYLEIDSFLNESPQPPAVEGRLLAAITLPLLLLAFVGGAVLNLMPCVFPILGLKVMSFVQQAGAGRRKVVLHGLVFTLGVLISFWVLAAALIILRTGGSELGWGFQLQSPAFVWTLTVILFAFGLNMSGVFEVGQSAVGIGSQLTTKGGLTATFFSGVLATVVATPCSAPFLAPALGVALALNPLESVIVFTSIGLGLALPYLLLSLFPQLMELLPRPGAWMETLKQSMAFLLYASVGYLLWVLTAQVGESHLLNIFIGLVVIAVACWVYGRWSQSDFSASVRRCGLLATLVLLVGGLYLGYAADSDPIEWIPWSPGKAADLHAQGVPVYVDFTARWCATCQVNKRVVFGSKTVQEAFREKGIVALKADWTQKTPQITKALEGFGRSAVPLNVLYIPGQHTPVILPELLTPATVLEALESLP